jgi:hypothetical protein
MTEKDRKYIDDKLYLLRKELISAIEEVDESVMADAESLRNQLSNLETKVARDEIESKLISSQLKNRIANFESTRDKKDWRDVVQEKEYDGTSTFLSNILCREITMSYKPEKHMTSWSEEEEDRLVKDFVYWANRTAMVHKRNRSGIFFRIVKLLKEVGIE